MFIPIGDQPNPKGIPWINNSLIAANVAVFVFVTIPLSVSPLDIHLPGVVDYIRTIARETGYPAQVLAENLTQYDWFVWHHGFVPGDPGLLTLLTSMFLHAGWAHLFGNMLFLWIFGDNVEHRLGKLGYLAAYLITGVAATLSHAFFLPESHVPMLGASGAISGVLGFYFVWFPRNQVRVFFWLYFWVDVILIPARWVLGFYLLVENLLPFVLRGDVDGVAHGAHIGGFVAGIALARVLREMGDRGTVGGWIARTDSADQGIQWLDDNAGRRMAPVDFVRDAMQANRFDSAVRAYLQLPARERAQLTAGEVVALGDWLAERGDAHVALVLFRHFLTAHPRESAVAAIQIRVGLILLYELQRPSEAYQYLVDGLSLGPPESLATPAREALLEIERLQKLQVRPRRWRSDG